jgi:hypothetical protein
MGSCMGRNGYFRLSKKQQQAGPARMLAPSSHEPVRPPDQRNVAFVFSGVAWFIKLIRLFW